MRSDKATTERARDKRIAPALIHICAFAVMGAVVLSGCLHLVTTRAEAWRSTCFSHLRQLGFGVVLYAMDHDGRYPWRLGASRPEDAWCDLGLLFGPGMIDDGRVFMCPGSKDEAFPFTFVEDVARSTPVRDNPKVVVTPLLVSGLRPGDSKHVISYAYCFDARGGHPVAWTDNKTLATTVLLLADKKAGITIEGDDLKRANHAGKGRNVLYLDTHAEWRPGVEALDPGADDDEIGKPDADDYRAWWSDPPWYGEGTEDEEQEAAKE